MEGNYSYKDCDNSGSSNNTDNDKDIISVNNKNSTI